MPANPGLADIPSNFTIGDYIDVVAGYDASCLFTGEGKMRFLCGPAHRAYNDPILYSGQEGASHLHRYFGNTLTDHNSDYESLRTTGDGTCQGGPLNRTAYWFPEMIKPAVAGFPTPMGVRPTFFQQYYSANPSDLDDFVSPNPALPHTTYGLRTFPRGLRFIFGWKHEHPIPDPWAVWSREHYSYTGGFKSTLPELYAASSSINTPHPVTGLHDNIYARFSSPTCWDGVNLTTEDGRAHMSYGIQDGYSNYICPATHPYRVPSVLIIAAFSNNGPEDWKNWYLSVDRHAGHNLAGGHGTHADWFGAWDGTIQDIWSTQHLSIGESEATNTMKTSVSGILCQDNWGLAQAPFYATIPHVIDNGWGSFHLPEAYRYEAIPSIPGQKRLALKLTAA